MSISKFFIFARAFLYAQKIEISLTFVENNEFSWFFFKIYSVSNKFCKSQSSSFGWWDATPRSNYLFQHPNYSARFMARAWIWPLIHGAAPPKHIAIMGVFYFSQFYANYYNSKYKSALNRLKFPFLNFLYLCVHIGARKKSEKFEKKILARSSSANFSWLLSGRISWSKRLLWLQRAFWRYPNLMKSSRQY